MTEKPSATPSLYVATVGVLGALMAVMALASIVLPPPLGSIDASSILIFAVAILYGPELGTTITVLGQVVGKGVLITSSGLPAVFIPGIVAVRGPEAIIVGFIGRRERLGRFKEPLAMVVGVLWETGGFVTADYYLFGPAGLTVVWTIIDLVWVPLGLAALYYVREAFKAHYLDQDMGLTSSKAKKGFILGSAIFIIVCWGLIIAARLLGLQFLTLPLGPP